MNNQSGQIELREGIIMEELSFVDTCAHLAAKLHANAKNLSENERLREYETAKKSAEDFGRRYLNQTRPIDEKRRERYRLILTCAEEVIKSLPESFYRIKSTSDEKAK